MGVFRSSAARVLRPQFDYSGFYDPAVVGPFRPSIFGNNNIDGGTAWTLFTGQPVEMYANINGSETISQYLSFRGFRFNIDPTKSIVGILAEFIAAADSGGPVAMTARLMKDFEGVGVIRAMFRRSNVPWNGGSSSNINHGGALDTWDEPWTPADINAPTFGIVFRRESAVAVSVTVHDVHLTVYTTDSVLPVLDYAAGTYTFGPTAIPVDKATILFYLDAVLHTVDTVSARLIVEISYNGGADWSGLMDSGVNIGGTFSHESGITEPRWWSRMGLLDPTNANRQFRGSLIIAGGSLTTSVGVFVD